VFNVETVRGVVEWGDKTAFTTTLTAPSALVVLAETAGSTPAAAPAAAAAAGPAATPLTPRDGGAPEDVSATSIDTSAL
jgi:putative Ca2+/H+ antiporter (TMEM165/GDT1 family)